MVVKVTFPEELKRVGPFSIPWWILEYLQRADSKCVV